MVQSVKKVVALTLAGAAAVLVAGWRRVQRDNSLDGDATPSSSTLGDRPEGRADASGEAADGNRPESRGGAAVEVDPDATKAELYEIAQKLDIEGRSSMTKAELLEAIRAAD